MALAEVFHLYTINTDFLLDYLFRICIITRMLTDARQLQRKPSNDGPLVYPKAHKGEKAVAKPLKEKPTYSKNNVVMTIYKLTISEYCAFRPQSTKR